MHVELVQTELTTVKARLARLKDALIGVIGVGDLQGLKSLELSLTLSGGVDLEPTINAIKVLIKEFGHE